MKLINFLRRAYYRAAKKACKKCPCHNLPCVWTSYNPELEPDKQDHFSCQITLEEITE